MRIEMQGRVFQGTALQIVGGLRALLGEPDLAIEDYVAWVAREVERQMGVALDVQGDDPEARAGSLLDELVRVGLARRRR
jgi:hypothetical protein